MLYNLLDTLDKVFDQSPYALFDQFEPRNLNNYRGKSSIRVLTSDDKEAFVVKASLPGVSKNDVELEIKDNVLTLSGKKEVTKKEDAKYHLEEREVFEFSRSVSIPYEIDTNKITASMENGILTVRLAKSLRHVPKVIEINS